MSSGELRVKGILSAPSSPSSSSSSSAPTPPSNSQHQIEVLDELVVSGNSALFRCHIPLNAQDYLQVVDWIEYPSELLLNYQTTSLANELRLFAADGAPSSNHLHRRQSQQLQEPLISVTLNNGSTLALGRYFFDPKTGNLHILNVDSGINYRSFRCRCKNKLTGELLVSTNKGKLIVTESQNALAPRLIASGMDSNQLNNNNYNYNRILYQEGELAILACNMQANPRAQVSWFRRVNEIEGEPIYLDVSSNSPTSSNTNNHNYNHNHNKRFVQVGNLLLIHRVSRNDSGPYVCHAKNAVGEGRLEMELMVRGK